jgi:WD40 repeat protein
MCANGILKVFNLQKGEVEGEMPYFDTEEGKREVVTRSSSGYWAFSHAGRMLAFAIERNAEDSKGQIVLWDAETRKFTVLCERDVRQILAFSPDGRFLVLCSWHFKGCLIEFWDTTRNQIDHTFEKDELVSELVFSPSGNAILAKGGPQPFANEVWFMDPITGSKGMELANLADFEFAPDGETILAVSSPSRAITRFDTATGKRMSEVRIPILFRAVLIPHTPAVVTQQDDRIAFWDIPPRRPLWWIVGGIGFPLVLILMLATGSRSLLRKPAEPHNSLVETEAVGN